jgi:hypothetical protein
MLLPAAAHAVAGCIIGHSLPTGVVFMLLLLGL